MYVCMYVCMYVYIYILSIIYLIIYQDPSKSGSMISTIKSMGSET